MIQRTAGARGEMSMAGREMSMEGSETSTEGSEMSRPGLLGYWMLQVGRVATQGRSHLYTQDASQMDLASATQGL